ncbi:hypothetical protein CerSpe_274200 [Prunus speciosa]
MPKLIASSSEGGADVFRFDYKGQPACLAQSPQLHKHMAIHSGFPRVFEIGPVFRAEDSHTHRHLCEFTSLNVEMKIARHYSEKELEAVGRQYSFEPLKDAGVEVDPMGDLNTETEKKLGQLVLEK